MVYYSLNNGSTWNSQVKTVTLNLSQGVISLKFYARDNAGNVCLNQTVSYTIDLTAPTVTASLTSGTYTTYQNVTLTASDNFDSNPSIYYTLNGTTPTTSSIRYTAPISIYKNNNTLKFIAVDVAGNHAAFQSRNYIINLPIVNFNTSKVYSSIQAAINDTLTLNGHVIELKSGNYIENIIVNKKLTIRQVSGSNVILQALNSSKPVFTVNAGGSGTVIQGFVIGGATNSSGVYLVGVSNCSIIGNNLTGNLYGVTIYNSSNNAVKNNNASGNNCGIFVSTNSNSNLIQNNTVNNNRDDGIFVFNGSNNNIIQNNSLAGNQYAGILINYNANTSTIKNSFIQNNMLTGNYHGIYLSSGSSNSTVQNNIVTNSTYEGVYIFAGSINNIVQNNNLTNNQYGISLYNNSNNTIYRNSIISNQYGIYLSNSSANINFNQITGNTKYGLYKVGNGTINATNNWWGINSPQISSTYGSALYTPGGGVNSTLWLMLNLTGSVIHVTKNSTSSSEITADLTHNNHGKDTSSSGALPEGIPVNFTATLPATIISSATTRRGKAVVTLTSSTNSSATTIIATADNQTVSKAFRKSFSSIQAAVNDPLTVNGDVIVVGNGTYVENIVVNRNLTIVSEGNVTVQAVNSSVPVFTINSGGSGSWIQGFNITGANQADEYWEGASPAGIFLNSANNCTILNNTLRNNYYGVYLLDSSYNLITDNIIMSNENGVFVPARCESFDEYLSYFSEDELNFPEFYDYCVLEYNEAYFGMHSSSRYNKIIHNSVRNNINGVYIRSDIFSGDSGSDDTHVLENDITNNNIGIYTKGTNANIHFNRITENNNTGLYIEYGAVDAINNWWGSNSPIINTNYRWWSNSDICDLYYRDTLYESGQSSQPPSWIILELFTPYLVLEVNPTSYKVSGGKIYESTITADLTQNSNGENTSSKGRVPDGIPVNFSTDRGTIANLSYTKNGKASSNLVLDPTLQSGMTSTTATVDGQGASTHVDRIAKAILTITSTALDSFTNQSLNLTYELPLNESISQISILWKEFTNNTTDPFKNELDIIVDGNIVQSKVFTNEAYMNIKNNYSGTYGFIFFDAISKINMFLADGDDINSEKVQLFLNIFQTLLTSQDFDFIMNNRLLFTDKIYLTLSYPGDSAKVITVDLGNGSDMFDLKFGGNLIQRMSTVLYMNGGYKHCLGDPSDPNATFESKDAGYEGVRSFAIATTEVTDETLQHWLNKRSLYPAGPMKAAYGTFLTSLLMIKCHDMVADAAASKFNVTWSRTTPIVVSVCDDAYEGYMTLECDHRFGMDVIGDPDNITAFRFACSSAINPIEHWVMKTLFPCLNASLEGNSSLERLYSSITVGLGQMLLNGKMVDMFVSNGYLVIKSEDNRLFLLLDLETGIVRDVMVTNSTFSYGSWCYSDQQAEWAGDLGNDLLSEPPVWLGLVSSTVMSSAEVGSTAGVLELGAAGTIMIEGGSVVGMAVAVVAMVYYPYLVLYEMPEKLRILEEINDMAKNQTPLWIETVSLFLPEDREPTLEELQEAQKKAAHLLMAIAENEDEESFDELNEMSMGYPHSPSGLAVIDKYKYLLGPVPIGGDDNMTSVGEYIKEKWDKVKEKWNNGDKIGVIKEFKWIIAGSSVINLMIIDANKEFIEEFMKNIYKDSNIGSGFGGGGGGVF